MQSARKEKEGWTVDNRSCDRCLLAKDGRYVFCRNGPDSSGPCSSCQNANKPCFTSTPSVVFGKSFEGRAVPDTPEIPLMTHAVSQPGLVYRKKRRVEAAAAGFDRTGLVPWCRPGNGRIVRASRYAPEQLKTTVTKHFKQVVDRWREGADEKFLKKKRMSRKRLTKERLLKVEDAEDSDSSTTSRSTKRSRMERPETHDVVVIQEGPSAEVAASDGLARTATPAGTSQSNVDRQGELPSSDLLDAIHMYASKRLADKGYDANFCMTGNSLVALGILMQEYVRNMIPEHTGVVLTDEHCAEGPTILTLHDV